jgi:hypothetical protein
MVAGPPPERRPAALLSGWRAWPTPRAARAAPLGAGGARGGAPVRDRPAPAVDGEPALEGALGRGIHPDRAPGMNCLYRMVKMDKDVAARRSGFARAEIGPGPRRAGTLHHRLLARQAPSRPGVLRGGIRGLGSAPRRGTGPQPDGTRPSCHPPGGRDPAVEPVPGQARPAWPGWSAPSAAMLKARAYRGLLECRAAQGSLERCPQDAEVTPPSSSRPSYVPDPARSWARCSIVARRSRCRLDLLSTTRRVPLAMGQSARVRAGRLAIMLEGAGFPGATSRNLPPEPGAKGPALILTTAARAGRARLRDVSVKEGERKR